MSQHIKTVKVGTFNLMNFMLPEKRMYGGSLFCTREEYRRKSEWINFMLTQMDADIIAFQELFHREAMLHIMRDNPKYRKASLYMAEETGDQPSVALLSRYPVENIEVFTHFPEDSLIDFNPRGRGRVVLPFTTFTRPVLRADVRIPDYGLITVFVVHLKSKREIFYNGEDQLDPVDLARAQSRSLMLRASEAVALRSLVARALEIPERPVILCGDVNDTGNAVTSRILSGEVPQHRLDDAVKRKVWDLLLYHVKDIQARRSYQDYYYTHIHNGMYESLDHIMVSQELVTEYPRNTGRVSLVSVFNDHLVDQTFTQHGVDKSKSDHGVVVCSLELDLDRAAKFMPDDGYAPEPVEDGKPRVRLLEDEDDHNDETDDARDSRGDDDAGRDVVTGTANPEADTRAFYAITEWTASEKKKSSHSRTDRPRKTQRRPIATDDDAPLSNAAPADIPVTPENGTISADDVPRQFDLNATLERWKKEHPENTKRSYSKGGNRQTAGNADRRRTSRTTSAGNRPNVAEPQTRKRASTPSDDATGCDEKQAATQQNKPTLQNRQAQQNNTTQQTETGRHRRIRTRPPISGEWNNGGNDVE